MSQSPVSDFAPENTLRYQQGWKALNRLLHEDRSFSGYERNCAFLNCGGKGFADISAVSGFDHLEDARAVVASDWDFDGDLDLWTTARTAPRLRLLQNRSAAATQANWLAVQLSGDGTSVNRSAVGARCELWLAGDDAPLLRSVHGGDAFLSQGSAWLHFGLGNNPQIARFVVRWPGGGVEEIDGLRAGGFFLLEQGAGQAKRWQPPANRVALLPSEPQLPPPVEAARIVLQGRMPPPPIYLVGADGQDSELGPDELRGPLLINIWASHCAPCAHELGEWSSQANGLRTAGLHILALDTDGLEGGDDGTAARVLDAVNYPFDRGSANAQTVRNLDYFQRAILDRWTAMPVPSSFLLDRLGRVAVIYKGPVSSSTLLEDMKLLDAPPADWRLAALPFPGIFISEKPAAMPLRVNAQFVDHDEIDEGLKHLVRYALAMETDPEADKHALGDLYFSIANLMEGAAGDVSAALEYYRKALALDPEDFRVRRGIAQVLIALDKHAAAIAHLQVADKIKPGDVGIARMLEQARSQPPPAVSIDLLRGELAKDPKNGDTRLQLANALRDSGDIEAALAEYRDTLRNSPRTLGAALNMGWIRAAHHEAQHRNPQEAMVLASRLNQVGGGKNVAYLDLLGAAAAASGDFDSAELHAQAALKLLAKLPAETAQAAIQAIRARLALYRDGKVFLLPE